ncbi:MAG: hypothetical protein RR998_07130 [Oscillospiraceae bacterium]
MKNKKYTTAFAIAAALAAIALCLALPTYLAKRRDAAMFDVPARRESAFSGNVSDTVGENELASAMEAGYSNSVVEREWLLNGKREITGVQTIRTAIDELKSNGVLSDDAAAKIETLLAADKDYELPAEIKENGEASYTWRGNNASVNVTIEPYSEKITGFRFAGFSVFDDSIAFLETYKTYLGIDSATDWEAIHRETGAESVTDGFYSSSLEIYVQATTSTSNVEPSVLVRAMHVPPEAAVYLPRVKS